MECSMIVTTIDPASVGRGLIFYVFSLIRFSDSQCTDEASFTCVSVSINEVATSNLFGLLRYLFCRNCFSNSSSCCDVKAVLGLLVFPRRACWAAQPVDYYTLNININIYNMNRFIFLCI